VTIVVGFTPTPAGRADHVRDSDLSTADLLDRYGEALTQRHGS
jgi:hypothetical protein